MPSKQIQRRRLMTPSLVVIRTTPLVESEAVERFRSSGGADVFDGRDDAARGDGRSKR